MIKMQWVSTLALGVFSAGALCLSAQAPHPTGQITGIAHVAYRVKNLEQEAAFFQKLGYEEAFASTANGKTNEVFIKINDHQFVEVYPQTEASQQLGWMHVCYEVGDLEAYVPVLTSRGEKATPVKKAGAGNLLSVVIDPDGRVTEFTQYMPGSRHTADQGQHLGANRVSTELLGFELPVTDVKAARHFYTDLGFDVYDTGNGLRLSLAGNNDIRIELPQYRAGLKVQALFPVADAKKAASQLQAAGVNASLQKKLVFVQDPDGNSFVLLETGTAQ
ncbi:MAG TPA: VOC family protein [Terracidiphilus sp.]|nr:VOC family protein [Terracidiphilus sp.]